MRLFGSFRIYAVMVMPPSLNALDKQAMTRFIDAETPNAPVFLSSAQADRWVERTYGWLGVPVLVTIRVVSAPATASLWVRFRGFCTAARMFIGGRFRPPLNPEAALQEINRLTNLYPAEPWRA